MADKKLCDVCGESVDFMRHPFEDGTVCFKCMNLAMAKLPVVCKSYGEVRYIFDQDVSGLSPEDRAACAQRIDQEFKDRRKRKIEETVRESQAPAENQPGPPAPPVPKCPRCGSVSISANKKGFGIGKAVIGAAVAGPIGLIAGNVGAKRVRITCLNCGHHWMAGK